MMLIYMLVWYAMGLLSLYVFFRYVLKEKIELGAVILCAWIAAPLGIVLAIIYVGDWIGSSRIYRKDIWGPKK